MAFVKFDRTKTVAQATASTRDNDTLYLTTNEPSIYFKGKRGGGDNVSTSSGAGYIYYIGNSNNLNDIFIYKYTADIGTTNLPPSGLIDSAAEYGDIDITVQMFTMSNPSHAFKQVCEMVWPNGTNDTNADILPTYERWERIKVGNTWYDWRKVQDSSDYPLHIYYYHGDNGGYDNIMGLAEGASWIDNIPSYDKRTIWDYVSNGGSDVTIHFTCSALYGEYCIKPDSICIYNDYNTDEKHIVLKFNSSIKDYLDITGFA